MLGPFKSRIVFIQPGQPKNELRGSEIKHKKLTEVVEVTGKNDMQVGDFPLDLSEISSSDTAHR